MLAGVERVRGLTLGGEEGRRLIEQAATRLESIDAPLERARTMLAASRGRHAAGDVAGARQAAQVARELAETCGATPLADGAVKALVAAGGRPRRTRSQGTAALTQAERRIAQQAAQGLSNREIAPLACPVPGFTAILALATKRVRIDRCLRRISGYPRRSSWPSLRASESSSSSS